MDSATKWNIQECDCEEVGGSCRLGHDEILRLRAALDKAEGERDDVTQGLLDMLRRAQLAEGENAKLLREIASYKLDREAYLRTFREQLAWLEANGYGNQTVADTLVPAIATLASPTQPAPAGEACKECNDKPGRVGCRACMRVEGGGPT